MIIIVVVTLVMVSFILAIFSMKDFHIPPEIAKILTMKKIRGTIVFFKDKVEHYSSSSSSSSI